MAVVTVRTPARHLCPFVEEVDNGTLTASWNADGDVVELHELRAALEDLASVRLTHEEFTRRIHAHLTSAGATNIHVSTEWGTAGFAVTIETT